MSNSNGSWHPLPYSEELAAKEERVRRLLAPFEINSWRPLVPSPDVWYYRNKMEYAFGPGEGVLLGLRQAGRFDRIVNVETCLLLSPESQTLIDRVRQWAREKGFTGYDRRSHQGDLRYLIVREGKNTGERMGILIAGDHFKERMPNDLYEWMGALATTFYIGFTDARGDVARAKDMRLLWGPETMGETLRGLRFQISAYSFFQTNTRGTEQLYHLLEEWAKGFGGVLLDMYCGAGGIALSLARHFDRVIGVDTNAEAIQDARLNAHHNQCGNVEFVAADAEEFLKKLPASKASVQLSAVVVDPPRPGLHPKALKALLELNPPRIAYVSCHPESLARDLQNLTPFYRMRSAQVVDLFPHTPHTETLVALEHR